MAVDVDPGDQPVRIELRVELGGVQVGPDPEHVHRAGRGARQEHGVRGQDGAGFLVAGEGREALRQPAQEGILQPFGGQLDGGAAQALAVGPVDHRALVQAQRADPVAGAEEREIRRHDAVQQQGQFTLHPVLGGAFVIRRVAGGEGAAAHDHPRVVGEVQLGQGPGFHPDAAQLRGLEPAVAQVGLVFFLGSLVLGARGKQ